MARPFWAAFIDRQGLEHDARVAVANE